MNKKLLGSILGIGAIIAIGLGVFLSIKTKDIKSHIEQTLNEKLESFVQENGLITEWEPFSCSGIINIGCYSPKIVATDEEASFIFENMGVDIDSIDNASLQASFNIKNLKFEVTDLDENDNELKKNIALLSSFIPHKVKCDISLKQNDDKLAEDIQCTIIANNATYQIQNVDTYQHESFKTQNIAQILQNAFMNEEESLHVDEYKYALNHLSFAMKDNGFSKDIYKYYELQSKMLGQPINQEGFEQSVGNMKMLLMLMLNTVREISGDNTYENETVKLVETFGDFVLGKNKEFAFTLKRKPDTQENFISLKQFLQEPYHSYLKDNFTFDITSK